MPPSSKHHTSKFQNLISAGGTIRGNIVHICCVKAKIQAHRVILGTNPPQANHNPAFFFVPQAIKILASPTRKTKSPENPNTVLTITLILISKQPTNTC